MSIPTGVRDIPGSHYHTVRVPLHAAATATESIGIWYASSNVRLISVKHVNDAAITGADTNTTHLNLLDKGTAGTGTTEIAHIDYISGVDAVANVAKPFLTAALTTFTAYDMTAGSALHLQYEKVGTGLAIGVATIEIEYQPR